MSVIVETPRILYGLVDDKPDLPIGWVYLERWRHWLFAIAPNGKKYYVSQEKLFRCKTATWWDVVRTFISNRGQKYFKLGQEFIDVREVIQL